MMIFSTMMLISMLSVILMILAYMISKKTFSDREKNSPFECGFDPKSSARMPFSLHFFLIAVIFLIFDVEITLLLPLIMIIQNCNLIEFYIISIVFVIILLGGLYHEWNQGALNWSK
uniref:NADH-ubiquinone oxidoreductase chain 3 n=1 Tax=Coraebus cavifrons TaxID=2823020 RepID=A0A8A6W5N4_9COLE|nr:NADH dehydrogenase subunit 3 [Coraebus cavifrons]QTK22429.1 NADH dehydrogenase subunit 3 [Coraebus cavifrons]